MWQSSSEFEEQQQRSAIPLVRLTITQDECSVGNLVGQWLAANNCAILCWRDPCHRLFNFLELGANSTSSMRAVKLVSNRLFRVTRGPWGTHKHGQAIRETGLATLHLSRLCKTDWQGHVLH